MEIKDIIQSALAGIMKKPGKKMKDKAYKKKMKGKEEDDDEDESEMPKEMEITIVQPMGGMMAGSMMDKLKKKAMKRG